MADAIIDQTTLNSYRTCSSKQSNGHNNSLLSAGKDFIIEEETESDNELVLQQKIDEENQRGRKAIWLIVFSVFVGSMNLLTTKLFFVNLERNQKVDPVSLIFIKSVVGLVGLIIISNKKLKKRIRIPAKDTPYLLARAALLVCSLGLTVYASKYIRLAFIGLTGNFTPLMTAILSFFILGEKLKLRTKMLGLFTFSGCIVISYGIWKNQQLKLQTDKTAKIPLNAYFAVIIVPFLSSTGNILMRKIKKSHWITLNLYCNILNIMLTTIALGYYGFASSIKQFKTFDHWDWALVCLVSATEISQFSLKLMAYRNSEPGRLAPYLYLKAVFSILYDLVIFNAHYNKITWIGLITVISAFAIDIGIGLNSRIKEVKNN